MEVSDRPLRIKTCLSSFERYCEQNSKCIDRLRKLRQGLNTTMTRYSKKQQYKSKDEKREEKGKGIMISTPRQLNHPPSIKKYKTKLLPTFNPELIEVTKIKLQSTQKYPSRFKTQCTIHRSTYKQYMKLKKTTDYITQAPLWKEDRQSMYRGTEQRNISLGGNTRYYRHGDEGRKGKGLDEIVVDLKYKRSKTNPHHSNIDLQQFLDGNIQQQDQRQHRRSKVVYSSMGSNSNNFNRYTQTAISQQLQPSPTRNKHKQVISRWQTKELQEDQFSINSSTQPLTTTKGISIR